MKVDSIALSRAQQMVWLGQSVAGDTPLYNMVVSYRISGKLERQRFVDACDQLVASSDILQSRIVDASAVDARQARDRSIVSDCQVVDIADDAGARAWIEQRSRQAIDPTCKMFDCALLCLPGQVHLFYWAQHHISTDGSNIELIIKYIERSYLRLISEKDSESCTVTAGEPHFPPDYYRFIEQEKSAEGTPRHQRMVDYWSSKASSSLQAAEFYARPFDPGYAISRKRLELGQTRSESVRTLASSSVFKSFSQDMSLFMVFATAMLATTWRVAQHSSADAETMRVGFPSHARNSSERRDMLGMFVSVGFLDIELNARDSFADLARKVQKDVTRSMVNLSPGVQSTEMYEAFSSTVNMIRARVDQFAGCPVEVEWHSSGFADPGTQLDLHITDFVNSGSYVLLFDMAASVFGETEQQWFLDHFNATLDALLTDSSQALAEYALTSAAANDGPLMHADTRVDYKTSATVIAEFEQVAETVPMQQAARSGEMECSYSSLNSLSNQIARWLQSQTRSSGLSPVVVVCMHRSIDMLAVFLGVMKSGCAYVPVDPEWPVERRKHIYEDTAAQIVLSSDELIADDEHPAVQQFETLSLSAYQNTNLKQVIEPSQLAYIMYTSGSTGRPKGVMVSHAGLQNYVCWAAAEFHQSKAVDYAFYSSVSFDLTMTCIYVPLISAGSVVVYSDKESQAGLEIQKVVLDDEVDVLDCTPAHLNLAIEALQRAGRKNQRVSTIILGGEEVRTEIARRALDVFNGKPQIINEYGPTEAVVGCTVHRYNPDKDLGISMPIGEPAANTRFYLLDARLQPVPVGVVGELCIARDPLAIGYLNAQQLTAEKFIPNPHEPDGILYRSGDLARWDEHRELQFLGREDDQVKLNGMRVEPGEVEHALQQLDAIGTAVVVVVSLSSDHQQLQAYYTGPAAIESTELREFLRQHLPAGMIPGRFIHLDTMPVTRLGKVDKLRLPIVASAGPCTEAAFVAPVSDVEVALAQIWAQNFDKNKIGLGDNFHELGGNSMVALQVVSEAAHAGLGISVQQILESATLGDLASSVVAAPPRSRVVETLSSKQISDADLSIIHTKAASNEHINGEGNIQDLYGLTNAQTGILFHCLRNKRSSIYSVQLRCDINGDLNAEAFKLAWKQLIERHDALRTVYLYENLGRPVQVVLQNVELPWSEHDLRDFPETDRDSWISRLAEKSFSEPFKFDKAPLLRLNLIRVDSSHFHLICESHHIALDGMSTQTLFQELQLFYSANVEGSQVSLQPALNMKPYLQDISGTIPANTSDFWKKKFAGFENPTSPILNPGRVGQLHASKSASFVLDRQATQSIRQLAASSRVTENTVFQAAWALLLARYNNTSDVVFGYTVNGRSANFSRDAAAVGMYVNTLPMRLDGLSGYDLLTFLHRVQHEQSVQAPFETSSLADIQRASELPANTALFDSLMVYQPFSSLSSTGTGAIAFSNQSSHENSHMPLTLEWFPSEHTTLQVLYSEELIATDAIETLVKHYFNLLASMAGVSVATAIKDLCMLESNEQSEIIALGSGQKTPEWPVSTVHEQFRKQACVTPHHIAIKEGQFEQSYAELDEQSDTLARYLASTGIGVGDTVGVCFQRSANMFPAMLAVMKTGARYVPLDPTYPSDRLSYMLENSGARLLLSDGRSSGALDAGSVPVCLMDSEWSEIEKRATDCEEPGSQFSDDMYVMYTSGSTGLPKGVIGTHSAALNRFSWMWRRYPFSEGEVCCQKTALGFVDSVWELFGPLLQGVTTVVIPDDDVLDIFSFVESLKAHQISRLVIVPSLLTVLLEADDELAKLLSHLKLVVVSGEPLPERLAARFLEILPDCRLINLYGSTEITADVTFDEVGVKSLVPRMPIGKAIDNVQIYVLDEDLQVLPRGAIGEIAVSGAGLSGGYHAQPELNLEKFVFNPHGPNRLFLTGDLGRFGEDGRLIHHGRRDSQIKIRGHRIETSEIENALLDVPEVSKAVVSVIGQEQLVAFTVLQQGCSVSEDQLQKYAAQRLPAYMMPRQWVTVDTIPLLPNGKINRLALRQQVAEPASENNDFDAPSSLNEVKLAGIWCDNLKIDRVGVNQDFFDLGGNSITAMQIMVDANRLGLALMLDQILGNPTIGQLAELAVETETISSADLTLSSDEILQSISTFNPTLNTYSKTLSPTELIWEQAAKTPDSLAATFEEQQLSYAELTLKSEFLASYLVSIGVRPREIVGVLLDRDLDLLVTLLAIMRCGAAYLPLDPAYPEHRSAKILDDSSARRVIIKDRSMMFDAISRLDITDLNEIPETWHTADEQELPEQVSADDLACLIYTSDASGHPKGIQMTRRNLASFLLAMSAKPGLAASDKMLAISPVAIGFSALELYGPLVVGGSTEIASTELAMDAQAVVDRMERNGVTVLQATPSAWKAILSVGWDGSHKLKALIGGEWFSRDLVSSLLPKVNSLWSLYGAAETTAWSVCKELTSPSSVTTLGKPAANCHVYILDENQRLCPIGVPGELCIAGQGVASGYLARPQNNTESFPVNEIAPAVSPEMFRTGDVAKWLPDGRIECFGRLDNQVLVNGSRIAPEEIEARLVARSDIAEAVVHLHKADGNEQLVAYVVEVKNFENESIKSTSTVAGDSQDDELESTKYPELSDSIKVELASVLPGFMIPAHVMILRELPRTGKGIVDKKSLPAPLLSTSTESAIDNPHLPENRPENDMQELIHSIWCRTLDRTQLSINSNFFELGGNSISAMQIMVSIKKSGFKTSLKQVMEQATIARLAAVAIPMEESNLKSSGAGFSVYDDGMDQVESIHAMLAEHPAVGSQDNVMDMFALTAQQRGILFHILLQGTDVPLYIAQLRCDFEGPLDLGCFERAWNNLVVRHDALRTIVLHEALHEPLQVIVKQGQLPYHEIDITHLDEEAQLEELDRIANDSLGTAIPVDRAPLLRVYVIKTAPEVHHVIVAFHHLLLDGWSISMLSNELGIFYAAELNGTEAELPQCGAFKDHVLAVNSMDEEEIHQFWKEHLAGLNSPTPIVTRPENSTGQHANGGSNAILDSYTTGKLMEFARTCRVTPNILIQSAWALLLSRYNNTDDVMFGFAVTGRSSGIANFETTVGMFINSLPMRIQIDPDKSVQEWFKSIQLLQAGMVEYEHSALAGIKAASSLPTGTELFDSQMVFQNFPTAAVDQELELRITNRRGHENSHMPFMLQVFPGEQMVFAAMYIEELFDTGDVETILSNFVNILRSMVALSSPQAKVSEISMISDDDIKDLVASLNKTEMEYPEDASPSDLIWQQAAKTPDRQALSFGTESLSYKALTEKADQLANYLIAQGAKADVLIGVCLQRGIDLMVTLLAIQRSGAAYLPLDPEYPQSRIDYILENADVPLLVSTSDIESVEGTHQAQLIRLDLDADQIAAAPDAIESVVSDPENLCYVIYTSGSTGLPKGVQLTRRNVTNFLCSMAKSPGISSNDTMLAVTTVAFDIAVLELYLPLLVGARVDIAARELAFDGFAMLERIREQNITMMQATPTTWRLLLAAEWPGKENFKALVGGEALPRDLCAQLVPLVGELWNMYGPTETTVWSTCEHITDPEDVISIGRPIGNTQIYILDGNDGLCPVNMPGELCIAGDGVAAGYLKRDELTTEKFIKNPVIKSDTGLIYRTGDVAKWLSDGRIECMGRMDSQVKLRGFRIELGEIETVLAKRVEISQAVVNLYKDNDLEILVAYIVTSIDPQETQGEDLEATLNEAELRKFMREHLPHYMIPGAFVLLDSIPLTPNGKIDRKVLPPPDSATAGSVGNSPQDDPELAENQPVTGVQNALYDIWCKAMHREALSIHTHFFDLGGNSISAMQIMAAAKLQGIVINLLDIFELGTIALLADSADTAEFNPERNSSSDPVPIRSESEQHQGGDMDRIAEMLGAQKKA